MGQHDGLLEEPGTHYDAPGGQAPNVVLGRLAEEDPGPKGEERAAVEERPHKHESRLPVLAGLQGPARDSRGYKVRKKATVRYEPYARDDFLLRRPRVFRMVRQVKLRRRNDVSDALLEGGRHWLL